MKYPGERMVVFCATTLLAVALVSGCGGTPATATVHPAYTLSTSGGGSGGTQTTFETGADTGWLTQEEQSGYVFRNTVGVTGDCFAILKSLGVSCIRLRMWVNPTGGWCGNADTLAKAKRAFAAGMRIMIDFHYSDTWADPGHQTIPAAWASYNLSQMDTAVYNYTQNTLQYLKSNGVPVSYVQVGNEITSGMLWPIGYVGGSSSFAPLASLVNEGYSAVKAVFPAAKVIVHLSSGDNNSLFRWFFDSLKAAGGKWDVTGMSFYPGSYGTPNDDTNLVANQKDMIARYGKPVCVCEIGYPYNEAAAANTIISKVVADTKALGANGLGVFYWEPEGYPNWQGYTLGACDSTGKFTAAMGSL